MRKLSIVNNCVRVVFANNDGSKSVVNRPRPDGERKSSFEDRKLAKRMKQRLGIYTPAIAA